MFGAFLYGHVTAFHFITINKVRIPIRKKHDTVLLTQIIFSLDSFRLVGVDIKYVQ